MGFGFYIDIGSTLSTAAATILAEPSISDDRFPGVSPKAALKVGTRRITLNILDHEE